MARELSPTLEAQQKYGLITQPYLIAKIRRKWGGVIRYEFSEVGLYNHILRPNGPGDETDIQSQAPVTGAHWDKVCDITPDEYTTMVCEGRKDSAYHRDLYALPTLAHSGVITQVKVYARALKANAPDYLPFKIALKTHNTVYESAPIPLNTSFTTFSNTWATNPNTGAAWTWDEIDDLQIGLALYTEYYIGIGVLEWCTQVYVEVETDTAQEDDYLHTAVMPSDGSLVRLRVANPDTTKDLYYQRIASPGPTSVFSEWTDLEIDNVTAIASCSNGADVSQFYANSDGNVYWRTSEDSGASWSSWTKIIDYWAYACRGMDAAYKPNGDIALTFLGDSVLREKWDGECTLAYTIRSFLSYCMSFTPAETHYLDYIELFLYRDYEPGTATVKIYQANADGFPTGGVLGTATFNANLLTNNSAGEWKKVEFTDILLDSAKTYCIVLSATGANDPNAVRWKYNSDNPYAGGHTSYSDDYGTTWTAWPNHDAGFRVYAYNVPPGRPSLYCYFEGNGASWEQSTNTAPAISNTTGITICYHNDWNIIATYGGEDVDKGIKAAIFGDGNKQAAGTWSAWTTLLSRESTEPFTYRAPCMRRPDTTRLYFVEAFTQEETQERLFYSHTPPSADFDDYAWLEPVPMDFQSEYGLAFTIHGDYAWLTNANTVMRALDTDEELDITSKLLLVDMRQMPDIRKGYITITIDNTNGAYNSFARLGDELTIGLGYKTPAGNEYSLASSFWITSYRLESPPWYPLRMIFPTGIIGTLVIEAQDAWDFLKRYKVRRTLSWAEGERSVLQLLQYFIARSGLDFEVLSQSSAIQNFKPEFKVSRGTTYRTIVKNLLLMVPDQLIFREAKAILRNPTTSEDVDWVYHSVLGTANLVFRGRYGNSAWDPNRAEVWGDTLMKTGAEWPQVQKVRDRLTRVTIPTYPDLTRAGERAAAELRRSEILTGEESWLNAPTNCGLEPWDKLQITDVVGGVSNILRRVLRIKTAWNAKHWHYQQIIVLGAD